MKNDEQELMKASRLNSLRGTMSQFMMGLEQGIGKHVERLVEVNFKVMKRMAEKDTLIQGIIKKRVDQMKPFNKITPDKDVRGFKITNIKTGKMDPRAEELMHFFIDTGFGEDPEREDDFIDVNDMIVRDLLTFDQIAIEIRRNKRGEVFDFWVVDGTTIKRNKDKKSKWKFVQIVPNRFMTTYANQMGVTARYTADDLIFDYMNKRAGIFHRGYGYSPVEQSIDMVTTYLFGMNYNRDQFIKDKTPKGFIAVMGDVNPQTIATIQRYWYQQMSGYGAKFKIPILPSGKEGIGMDFKKLGDSNKDMQYDKLMQMVMAIKASVFGIDLLELGIKFERTSTVIGESGEPRLQHSKDSGLGGILIFLENLWNKILKKIDNNYRFEYVGLKDEDKEKEETVKKSKLGTTKTIDELREEDGDKPFNEEWSRVPLNEQAVQMIMAEKSAQQQKEQFGGGGGFGEEAGGAPGEVEESEEGAGKEPEETDEKENIGKSVIIRKSDNGRTTVVI